MVCFNNRTQVARRADRVEALSVTTGPSASVGRTRTSTVIAASASVRAFAWGRTRTSTVIAVEAWRLASTHPSRRRRLVVSRIQQFGAHACTVAITIGMAPPNTSATDTHGGG